MIITVKTWEAVLPTLLKKMFGWVLIIGAAFSPALFAKLATIIYALPDEIAGTFSGGYKFNASAMDVSFAEVMKLLDEIEKLHDKYQWWEFDVHLSLSIKVSVLIVVAASVIIGLSFAFYTVAKISLALVLMLGPFFIGCFLFPPMRQYGMNWIGQCLNYIITSTMYVLLTMSQLQAFDNAVKMAFNGGFADAAAADLLAPVFILQTVIFLVIAFSIPNIASALTGGAAVQGAMRQLGQMAGMASAGWGLGVKTAKAVSNATQRRNSISSASAPRKLPY